jgi:hypothetical protein
MATAFDNIVTKENDHTALLQNLMERHAWIAAAVMTYLLERDVTEEVAASFVVRSQSFHLSEAGRAIPDLLVRGPGLHCLIEVKVDPWLELTTAQQGGYQSCFPMTAGEENKLCFLVPNDWKHTALGHLVREALPESVKSGVFYWKSLISALEKASKTNSDPILDEVILFWKHRFEVEPMTDDERNVLKLWSGQMYSAVSKLEKSVSQARALFEARDWRTELETDTSTFGFYLRRGPSYVLWVGIWTKAPAPLCMGVHARQGGWIRPRDFALAPAKTSDNVWHLWPLESEDWDDAERIYQRVVLFIDSQYEAQ